MNDRERLELFKFFAGYFHEDWSCDAETDSGIVATFRAASSGDERAHMADLIEAFADSYADDRALERALFKDLGCYYNPSADGRSARDWLQCISGQMRA